MLLDQVHRHTRQALNEPKEVTLDTQASIGCTSLHDATDSVPMTAMAQQKKPLDSAEYGLG